MEGDIIERIGAVQVHHQQEPGALEALMNSTKYVRVLLMEMKYPRVVLTTPGHHRIWLVWASWSRKGYERL
jgi:hypothetical protein